MENSRKVARKNNMSAFLTKNKMECKEYNDFIALYPHLYADHLSILVFYLNVHFNSVAELIIFIMSQFKNKI